MDFGSPTLNAMGALGYGIARLLLTGLQTTGAWIFLLVAIISLSWTCIRPSEPNDPPGSLIRHFLAVLVATVFCTDRRRLI